MSYLPPQETGFYEAIQVYFTEVTDRVALFGARDRALLDQWKDEGRSAQVVCRGIREAIACRDGGLRSLAQCEPYVDRQWEAVQQNTVGCHDEADAEMSPAGSPTPPKQRQKAQQEQDEGGGLFDQVRRAIRRAGESAGQERWRSAYRTAWREMQRIRPEGEGFSFAEVEAVDAALVEAYMEALHDEERRVIESSLAEVNQGYVQGMSPSARREHLRVKRKRAIIERFGLLDLLGELGA